MWFRREPKFSPGEAPLHGIQMEKSSPDHTPAGDGRASVLVGVPVHRCLEVIHPAEEGLEAGADQVRHEGLVEVGRRREGTGAAAGDDLARGRRPPPSWGAPV